MELSPEQLRARDKFLLKGRGIAWHMQGEGKTRIPLSMFALLQTSMPRILCVVTRRVAFHSWRKELEKCGLNYHVVDFTGKKNWSVSRPTVLLVSHGVLAKSVPILSTFPISFLVYDELYLYSNPKSQRSVAATFLAKCVRLCVGLSGTIMPAQDNTSVWGQCKAVGLEHLLARNLTQYRSTYQCNSLVDFGGGKVYQFSNAPGWRERAFNRLGEHIDVHFPKGKRRIETQIIDLEPTKQQLKLIKQLKDEYYLELEEEGFQLDSKSATEIAIRVQQISNGWLQNKEGHCVEFVSPKVEMLSSQLEDIIASHGRAIVWCAFRHDIDYLKARLPFKTLVMRGGEKFDVARWESGDYPVVLATAASGASVNFFNQVPYAIYYSLPNGWLHYDQSRKRTDRKDSKHGTCHYIHLHCTGTLDQHVYERVTESGDKEREFVSKMKVLQWLKER